jgi:hypothetical protein
MFNPVDSSLSSKYEFIRVLKICIVSSKLNHANFYLIISVPDIPNEDYMEFFKAVKYFKVEELYKICREHILKMELDLGNAIDVYETCKVLEEKELEEAADEFIKKYFSSLKMD